jgi:hypothetical protein
MRIWYICTRDRYSASLSVALIKPGQLHEKNLSAGPISGAWW